MDFVLKIIFAGNEQVDINSIIEQYTKKPKTDFEKTLGLNLYYKTIEKEDRIDLAIWKLSSLERHKSLTQKNCYKTNGAFYVINPEKPETIEYIKGFINDNPIPEYTIELLMTTLDQKMNDEQLIQEFGKPIKQFPVSIETGEGINEAFNYLITNLIKREKEKL